MSEGEQLRLETIRPEQHFTEPPPRYTEATLVKELEEKGIGRPSTYAAIISTIVEREYVNKDQGRFTPTMLGERVSELLVKGFEDIFDVGFTARLEEELDEIEEGKLPWRKAVKEFWDRFDVDLDKADDEMDVLQGRHPHRREVREVRPGRTARAHQPPRIFPGLLALSGMRFHPGSRRTSAQRTADGETNTQYCDNCGKEMVIKRGRFGTFLACTGYPDCKTTRRLVQRHAESATARRAARRKVPDVRRATCCAATAASANSSAAKIIRSASTRGPSRWASNARSATKANSCAAAPPRDAARGRIFYGCSRYPDCDFTTPHEPIAEPCPKCGAPFIVEKRTKQGNFRSCIKEGCDWEIEAPLPPLESLGTPPSAAAPAVPSGVAS